MHSALFQRQVLQLHKQYLRRDNFLSWAFLSNAVISGGFLVAVLP
jgi:hypothetical protein